MGGLLGVRCANTVAAAFEKLDLMDTLFITDSTALHGLLKADNGSLGVFSEHRVAEILDSSKSADWLWVASVDNPADLAEYTQGPKWLSLPRYDWPVKEEIDCSPPAEEMLTKKVVNVAAVSQNLFDVSRCNSFTKLTDIAGLVFKFCYIMLGAAAVSMCRRLVNVDGELQTT